MESHCEYTMFFPATPISSLSNTAKYATLPQRNHVYLGETVQFLFVLRFRETHGRAARSGGKTWEDLVGSLCALATVCVAESRQLSEHHVDPQKDDWDTQREESESESIGDQERKPDSNRNFKHCNLLFTHSSKSRDGLQSEREPVKSSLVLEDKVIFCLTVSLDKLPANTSKAKFIVTVWKQEESVEVREHGYLTLMQLRSPTHTFKQDLRSFQTQVSAILKVLSPPGVLCQQMTVCGKHATVLKVINCNSKDEVCVIDVKILPNYNMSYLPVMPDGSIFKVDNVCHQSGEATMASFSRIDSKSSRLPSVLCALEEQNFLFQLQLQNKLEDNNEGLEVRLVAMLKWCVAALPLTRYICSCYRLPSIRLDRPKLVMTASCPRAVKPLEQFWVKYTLLNNLQDFLAVRLIWNSEVHREAGQEPVVGAVICQSTINDLGHLRKGSTLSFTLAFQILKTGLFEMTKNMKLKVQFIASMSTPSLEPLLSFSPTGRDLLGRSEYFSQQQTYQQQHVRSGSIIEQQIISPTGRLMTHHMLSSLDKIAKRECKVLVHKAHFS